MKKYLSIILECDIFRGMESQLLEETLLLLDANTKSFKKGETVYDFYKGVHNLGIIVSGVCQISKADSEGNRNIFRKLTKGFTFGETLIFSGIKEAPILVSASTNCTVVFVDAKKLTDMLGRVYKAQTIMSQNIIRLLAQEAFAILIKNDILSKKTIRKKLMAYFLYHNVQKDMTFKMPYSHEELADYLSVNRSALSRELTLMRREGIISYGGHNYLIKHSLPPSDFK